MNYLRPGAPMRMRRSRRGGLGDDCANNPCSWWDDVYLRDSCMSYLQSCDPNNALLTVVQKGLIVGGAQVVGGTVGTAANTATTSFVDSLFGNDPTNPQGSGTNWGMVALFAAGGIGALMILPKLLGGRR